jgi:hypothetical protein
MCNARLLWQKFECLQHSIECEYEKEMYHIYTSPKSTPLSFVCASSDIGIGILYFLFVPPEK